jgi:polyhydroxyalkanoic acid synthase PhaR subunit
MPDGRTEQDAARADPFGAWNEMFEQNEQAWTKAMKDFYEANETIWTKAMRDATTTELFAEAQGKMLESFLAFQKMLREGTTAQLSALNLPTHDDVSRLGELVVGLEEKVDQIEDRITSAEEMMEKRLGDRVAKVEKGLTQQLDQQLDKMQKNVIRHLDEQVARIEKELVRQLDERFSRIDQQGKANG